MRFTRAQRAILAAISIPAIALDFPINAPAPEKREIKPTPKPNRAQRRRSLRR